MEDVRQIAPFVIIETPFAGNVQRNVAYARACVRDSIMRGEAPYASHLIYTQPGILCDKILAERELGMGLGWHVMRRANLVCAYVDLGWSSGMKRGVAAARDAGKAVVERTLMPPGQWEDQYDRTFCVEVHLKTQYPGVV